MSNSNQRTRRTDYEFCSHGDRLSHYTQHVLEGKLEQLAETQKTFRKDVAELAYGLDQSGVLKSSFCGEFGTLKEQLGKLVLGEKERGERKDKKRKDKESSASEEEEKDKKREEDAMWLKANLHEVMGELAKIAKKWASFTQEVDDRQEAQAERQQKESTKMDEKLEQLEGRATTKILDIEDGMIQIKTKLSLLPDKIDVLEEVINDCKTKFAAAVNESRDNNDVNVFVVAQIAEIKNEGKRLILEKLQDVDEANRVNLQDCFEQLRTENEAYSGRIVEECVKEIRSYVAMGERVCSGKIVRGFPRRSSWPPRIFLFTGLCRRQYTSGPRCILNFKN